jgi:hypothetical protein
LSWRALLFARAQLPELTGAEPQSALLEGQGIAVFRRDNARGYVALDYGHSGGGHGHPDRLNVLLVDGDTRWLDDYGTGSYTDRSLHWYRSTLAHNAPLVNGKSQQPTDGVLVAYDERGDVGWTRASAFVAPDVDATRTIVVTPGYAIDVLEWRAPSEITLDLPLHVDLAIEHGAGTAVPDSLLGGDATEDGFDFVRETSVQHADANTVVIARAEVDAHRPSPIAHRPTQAPSLGRMLDGLRVVEGRRAGRARSRRACVSSAARSRTRPAVTASCGTGAVRSLTCHSAKGSASISRTARSTITSPCRRHGESRVSAKKSVELGWCATGRGAQRGGR